MTLVQNIKHILEEHPEIKSVSFDIFDTVIFRSGIVPDRIFFHMYENEKKIFPAGLAVGDWVSARRVAEKRARSKLGEQSGRYEVTLNDIYAELPTVYSNYDAYRDAEVASEIEAAVANQEALEAILWLAEQNGIKLYMISDMYLKCGSIISILLAAGIPIEYFSDIYISCEHNCSKRDGKLFAYVLEQTGEKAETFLHVGDNLHSDVEQAIKCGMYTIYYSLIPEMLFRHPALLRERELNNSMVSDQLYLLRVLSTNKTNSIEDFWYNTGALVLGPFFTAASEAIVQYAKEHNVRHIRTFMREGAFLARLVENAVSQYELDIDVAPIYISRLAAYQAEFENLSYSILEKITRASKVTPNDLMRILHISKMDVKYEAYRDVSFNKLRELKKDGYVVSEMILHSFLTDENREQVKHHFTGYRKLFFDYLKQSQMLDHAMTVDLGWNGTTMKEVYDVLQSYGQGTEICQMLVLANRPVAENATSGCIIDGYYGNYGSRKGNIDRIFAPLLETMCGCNLGPTIGYEKNGEMVEPVLGSCVFSEQQLKQAELVQEGILYFQNNYYCLDNTKRPNILDLKDKVFAMLSYMFTAPMVDEAQRFGGWVFDQNVGIENRESVIVDMEVAELFRKGGITEFYTGQLPIKPSMTWYSAYNSLCDPMVYLKNHYLENCSYKKLAIVNIVETLAGSTRTAIVMDTLNEDLIFGLSLLNAIGGYDKLIGIYSSNTYLIGVKCFEREICSVCELQGVDVVWLVAADREEQELLMTQVNERANKVLTNYSED